MVFFPFLSNINSIPLGALQTDRGL